MKKIFHYFKEFHKGYFNHSLYVVFLLFVGLLITLNYKFNIENSFIDSFYGKYIRILLYFGIHALAYYGVLLIIWVIGREKLNFTGHFWLKSFIGLLILGVDRSIFPMISRIVLRGLPHEIYTFYYKILFNSYGLFTILFTMVMMKFFFDRKEEYGIYGLRFKKVDYRPYLIMFLFMIPIVYIATYLPDFLHYYPTYKRVGGAGFAGYYGFPEIVSKIIYEPVYLFDFMNTELFFRGFLVIGLSKLLGKNVILPMAATYAVLHFGKPMGETISSVFGGYILGIIALYTRNIWGGVFLHGGVAFLMEIFAFWRH
jgi:hypothetical protein